MAVARVAAHDILLGEESPTFGLKRSPGFQSTGLQTAKMEENVQVRQTKYRDGMKVGQVWVAYVLHFTCVATMP